MSELKPLSCPFCGNMPEVIEDGYKAIAVHCFNCGADITAETARKAISAWNRRAQPDHIGDATAMVAQPDNAPLPSDKPLTQADIDKMHFDKVWISYSDDPDDGEWGVVLYGQLYNLDTMDGADFKGLLEGEMLGGERLDCPSGEYTAFRRKPEPEGGDR